MNNVELNMPSWAELKEEIDGSHSICLKNNIDGILNAYRSLDEMFSEYTQFDIHYYSEYTGQLLIPDGFETEYIPNISTAIAIYKNLTKHNNHVSLFGVNEDFNTFFELKSSGNLTFANKDDNILNVKTLKGETIESKKIHPKHP